VPLSTLELQKKGTQLLRVSGDQIMTAAESLYQQGLISYPRTETDQFDPAENVHVRLPVACTFLQCCLLPPSEGVRHWMSSQQMWSSLKILGRRAPSSF
jgi:DNA topoisomerase IA